MPSVLDSLAMHNTVAQEVVREIGAALTRDAYVSAIAPLQSTTGNTRGQFIDSTYRADGRMTSDLEDLAGSIAQALTSTRGRQTPTGPCLDKITTALDALAPSFLELFRKQLLSWIFGAILADDANEQNRGSFSWEAPPIAMSGAMIAKILEGLHWFDKATPSTKDYLTRSSAKCLAEAAAEQLASACLHRLPALDTACVNAVKAALIASLQQEDVCGQATGSAVNAESMRARCRRAVARRDFHGILLSVLVDVQAYAMAALEPLVDDDGAIHDLTLQILAPQLWHRWSEWFIAREGRADELFGVLPWHLLTDRQLRSCMRATQGRLMTVPTPREVCFSFRGLDLHGRFATIGRANVYDARIYDFGEGGHDITLMGMGTAKTFARITTYAVSNAQAQLAAVQTLYATLDTLVFVSDSPPATPFAFRPEVETNVDISDRSTGDRATEWHPYRRTLSTIYTADDDFMQVVHNYDDLLRWEAANRPSAPRSHLVADFFRAIDSFRKGRWATNPADTFLFEWIGIESLFERNALFGDAPRLYFTWFDIDPERWTQIYAERKTLVRDITSIPAIKARLDADPDLADWDQDTRILLQPQNASKVLRRIPRRERLIRQRVADFSRMLRQVVGSRQTLLHIVDNARERCQFTLHYLYTLRNAMVHDAALSGPQTEIYADALDEIFRTILSRVGNVLLNLPGSTTTVAQVIDWYQPPFT